MTELISDCAADNANSYVTLEEAEEYIAGRDGFDIESWNALTDEQKATRLVYGTYVIDSLRYRGRKACRDQALQFPRIMPDSKLSQTVTPFWTYEDLQDFSELFKIKVPDIPGNVKLAQMEAAYQIVHSHILTLEPFDTGEDGISSLSIDAIHLSFQKSGKSPYTLFDKADFGASSTISLLLKNYLYGGLRGALI